MWNKKPRILWLKLYIKDNRHFFLTFPLPLYVLQELLDCLADSLMFAGYVIPNGQKLQERRITDQLHDIVSLTMELLNSVAEEEPYDLVDVSTDKVKLSIKIR